MISHAFSSPVADLTGTVTNWVGATTASAIATEEVRPSDWNSAHVGVSTFAGNTLGASSWSGTNLVLAAVTNLTLSYAANGLSIVGPDLTPYLTTAQAPGAYLTTAALSNHSHGNPTLALTNLTGTTASNSAGLTLSLSAGDLTNFLTTAALSNHSHGNPTLALTNISGTTASNSAGLTLSLSAGAGGGAGANASFWDNFPYFANVVGTQGTAPGNSQSVVFPALLQQGVSADFARFFASRNTNSTTLATSANVTFSAQRAHTFNLGLYVQGTGANSTRIESVVTTSIGSTQQVSLQANANGSEYTVSYNLSYPRLSGTSSTQITYAATQTNFSLVTTNLTAFTGYQIVDIPFASAIPASNYWVVLGSSSATTTGGVAGATALNVAVGFWICANQFTGAWGAAGVGNNSSIGAAPILGSYSVAGGATQATIAASAVSTVGSNLFPRMQLIAGLPNG